MPFPDRTEGQIALGLEGLGLADECLDVLQRVRQQVFHRVFMDGHALSRQPVVGADHLEIELRADPHGVGIDDLADNVGSGLLATTDSLDRQLWAVLIFEKCLNQSLCLALANEVIRLVFRLTPCRLVEVIEAVASFRVLLDGDGVDGAP